jgi:hypothetical protein
MLADIDPTIREVAVMVASELVENALKHGRGSDVNPIEALDAQENICFALTWSHDEIEIEASNLATDAAADVLRQNVQRINDSPNPEELYMERLHALLEDRTKRGGLGLYRIAFEGEFKLAFRQEGRRVTITAKRRLR